MIIDEIGKMHCFLNSIYSFLCYPIKHKSIPCLNFILYDITTSKTTPQSAKIADIVIMILKS